jgi:hypothetical protein
VLAPALSRGQPFSLDPIEENTGRRVGDERSAYSGSRGNT